MKSILFCNFRNKGDKFLLIDQFGKQNEELNEEFRKSIKKINFITFKT